MMKFIITLFFNLIYCFQAVALGLGLSEGEANKNSYSWSLVGPDGGGYTNFVLVDPRYAQRVYAGVDVGGIYKSDDYGENWTPLNKGLNWPTDRLTAALTIDPKNGAIYLGVGGRDKGGIFKRARDNDAWQLLTRKIKFNGHEAKQTRGKNLIAIDPLDSNIIYAGSYKDGIFKSTDAGRTWANKGLVEKHISSIIINPSNPRMIYVAAAKVNSQDGGIYKSIDGGESWMSVGGNIVDACQMVMDPVDPKVIYVASGNQGVFKTTNGGKDWAEKNKGLSGLALSKFEFSNIKYISLDIASDNPKVLYLGSGKEEGQIYKSVDAGESWNNITESKKNIFLDGWWKTQPIHWPGGKNYSANCLSINPENNNQIYVSGRAGIWRSDDGGATWHVKVYRLAETCLYLIAVHPKNQSIFFVGSADWVMFKTADGGKTFSRPLGGIGNWDIKEDKNIWRKYNASEGLVFAIDSRNDSGAVYLGLSGASANTGTIFKSIDGGQTWYEANKGLPVASVTALAIDSSNQDILYAILQGYGLFHTIDAGRTWEKINIDIKGIKEFEWGSANVISIHPQFSNIIYILAKKIGIYKTINGGRKWELVSRSLPQEGVRRMDQFVGGLAVDSANPDTVYAGLHNNGLYKSIDGGKRWEKITPSYMHHGGAISIEPIDGAIYLASVPGVGDEDIEGFVPGIYKSIDGGNSWIPIHNDELLNISLKITFLTVDKGKIYITTQGNGVIIGEPIK